MGALAYLCDDTRGDWNATASSGNVYAVPVSDKDQFLNHHDGGSPVGLFGKAHASCLSRVKSIQTYHKSKGWLDIGYNSLVCVHARLVEGRGVLTVGAQCPGYNRSGVGSQFMVGGSEKPTQAMYDRQRKFYNDLQRLREEEYMRKMGHRDGVATECPGDIIEAWVKNGMPSSGIAPAPVPTPTPVTAPGPHYEFPLPSSDYYFGRDDGTRYSVSGYYDRTFGSKTARSWIQEFGSQMTRRGWNVGKGKTWLTTDGNNGYFGREYEALVKKVQDVADLRVDGRLGPKTWRWVFFSPVT